jgi:2-keto-4-pentenoate hydratase/2-oxohepta-3-ene-1,7-dioic acid hydratase in catechol pathway
MKWATFRTAEDPAIDRVGVLNGEKVYARRAGTRLVDLIKDGQDALLTLGDETLRAPASTHKLADVRLRPPVPRPPAVRDFASFREHIEVSMGNLDVALRGDWFDAPTFYFTSPNNLFGDGDMVRIPGDTSQMDYELEVCAVIGIGGMDIAPADAHRHIAGYTIFNDWSARDLQAAEMRRLPVGPGKGKDSSTSMGPFLVTPEELADRISGRGFDLKMTARVNGAAYSAGNLSSIGWSFAEMIAFASRSSPLMPGDVIGSGTVGTGCILELSGSYGLDRFPWLKDGDEVVLEVERLGTLRNILAWNNPPLPLRR